MVVADNDGKQILCSYRAACDVDSVVCRLVLAVDEGGDCLRVTTMLMD